MLKVGNKPIIEHILEKIESVNEVEEVLVVTNARFYDHFRVWLNDYTFSKKIKIINDGTISNDDRLGAVGDINFVLKEEEIKSDLLVIAGDNLFGFELNKLIGQYKDNNKSIVAFRDLKDVNKTGLNDNDVLVYDAGTGKFVPIDKTIINDNDGGVF